jgi:uncharacterized membrane protein
VETQDRRVGLGLDVPDSQREMLDSSATTPMTFFKSPPCQSHEFSNEHPLSSQTDVASPREISLSSIEEKRKTYINDRAAAIRKAERSTGTTENSGGNFILNNIPNYGTRGFVDRTTYYSLIELLTNPNVYSGSVHDLNVLDRTIQFISKIDRLPASNSFESLKMLQDAWDHVEVYDRYASYYKCIALISYIILLLLSIGVTISTLLALTDHKNKETTISSRYNLSVVVISFITLVIIAVVSYFNPAFRWPQLRSAALNLRSHIYLFRTRAGPYRLTAGHIDDDEYADRVFRDALSEIKRGVLEGADVRLTTLFSSFHYRNCHNQHYEAPGTAPKLTCWQTIFVLRQWFRRWCLMCICGSFAVIYRCIQERVSDGYHRAERILQELANHGTDDTPDDDCDVEYECDVDEEEIKTKIVSFPLNHRLASLSKLITSPSPAEPQSLHSKILENRKKHKDEDTTRIRLDEVIEAVNHYKEIYSPVYYKKERYYEPLTPDLYLKFRVEKALTFYRDRVHTCVFYRFISKVILVAGSILIIGLSFFQNTITWTAAVTIVTASVSALLEFHDTTNKLERYNITVESLEKIRLWWQSIPEIDRSSVDNIDKLVLTCEDVLQREQQAWKASASHMIKMLEKAMKDESGNNSSSAENKAVHGGGAITSNQQFKSGIAPV